MNILLVEPFFTGSHKRWSIELSQNSSHNIDILSLPGRHWKWRMEGGAIELADRFKRLEDRYQLLLVSDMLDLSTFKALTGFKEKVAIYFHENQISYPWSPTDPDIKLKRDVHYGFINYKSALCADKLFFNSSYHLESFFHGLDKMLKAFPDFSTPEHVTLLKEKAALLPLGLDLISCDQVTAERGKLPLILWNHRWEYDKNPELFFEVLFELADEGVVFELAVLGESFLKTPAIFEEAKRKLSDQIVQWGRVESKEEYVLWLKRASILPVTNHQDFFGISVVEAIHSGCYPLLPKRLAYPEHVDSDEYFYRSEDELKEKLRSACQNYPKLKVPSVEKYDWKKIIPSYDKALLSLVGDE